jgi:hypothetical protein
VIPGCSVTTRNIVCCCASGPPLRSHLPLRASTAPEPSPPGLGRSPREPRSGVALPTSGRGTKVAAPTRSPTPHPASPFPSCRCSTQRTRGAAARGRVRVPPLGFSSCSRTETRLAMNGQLPRSGRGTEPALRACSSSRASDTRDHPSPHPSREAGGEQTPPFARALPLALLTRGITPPLTPPAKREGNGRRTKRPPPAKREGNGRRTKRPPPAKREGPGEGSSRVSGSRDHPPDVLATKTKGSVPSLGRSLRLAALEDASGDRIGNERVSVEHHR